MNTTTTVEAQQFEDLDSWYHQEVDIIVDQRVPPQPDVSVIVVTYNAEYIEFQQLLAGLNAQTSGSFETIIIDNGTNWDLKQEVRGVEHVSTFVQLRQNCGITFARNLGAHLSRGEILAFLDDDGIPDIEFVQSHQDEHRNGIIAVRGRILPHSDTLYNRLQSWYDLGDERLPFLLNIEGNCSVNREAFLSVGGFEEELEGVAGHEGIDLTYRLIRDAGYDREQIIYSPAPLIYHDMARSLGSYLNKRATQRHNRRRLIKKRPGINEFADSYTPPQTAECGTTGTPLLAAYLFDGITRYWGEYKYYKYLLSERLST